MFSSTLLNLSVALLAASNVVSAGHRGPRSRGGFSGPALHCFNHEDDEPLDLKVEDITHVGNQLRADGRHDHAGVLFNLGPGSKRVIIEEGSVSVILKNTNKDTPAAVLLEDVANTIDGGETRDEVGPALIQCLSAGGIAEVYVDFFNPAYNTDEYYKSGATPEGVILKLASTEEEDL